MVVFCCLLFVVVCCCLETSCAKAINADVGSSKLPVSFQGMIQDIMFFHSCHFLIRVIFIDLGCKEKMTVIHRNTAVKHVV